MFCLRPLVAAIKRRRIVCARTEVCEGRAKRANPNLWSSGKHRRASPCSPLCAHTLRRRSRERVVSCDPAARPRALQSSSNGARCTSSASHPLRSPTHPAQLSASEVPHSLQKRVAPWSLLVAATRRNPSRAPPASLLAVPQRGATKVVSRRRAPSSLSKSRRVSSLH